MQHASMWWSGDVMVHGSERVFGLISLWTDFPMYVTKLITDMMTGIVVYTECTDFSFTCLLITTDSQRVQYRWTATAVGIA